MSLGLIKPGASVALRHPKTGALIEPIGYLKDGRAVWPVLGAAPDDEDDDKFTGSGGGGDDDSDDEDDEDDDEDEDDDDTSKSKRRKSSRKSKSDDDDDDDDDDDGPPRAVRQAKRYRLELRKAQQQLKEAMDEIKAIKNKDKDPDSVVSEELTKARGDVETLTEANRTMAAQLAFFKTPHGIRWVDPSDAFALAEREGLFDDVIDEDGTVDTRELKRGLRDLAKRKKYLVEKPRGSANEDDDTDEDDEEEERPRRSARTANSRRRGSRDTTKRAALEAKFPVLRGR